MIGSNSVEFAILLVEDNPGDQDLILAYLEGAGKSFHVETAGTLGSALKMLDQHTFNVVFLDLGLPDSIGLDTLRLFTSKVPDIPVIVLTGLDDEQLGIEAIRIGAQDYLIKGQLNTNMLFRSLRYAIERGSLSVRLKHYNRKLNAIRSINQLIVREKDRNVLIQSACDMLVEEGHYPHGWITLFDATKKSMAFASAGMGGCTGDMRALFFNGALPPCCEKVMVSEEVLLIDEKCSECLSCPLAQTDIGSCGMVVSLPHKGKIFGVMALAISKAFNASADELSLVKEVASDIGLALYAIDEYEQKQKTRVALQASEQKHKNFLANLNTGVVAYGPDTIVLYCNQKASDLLGMTKGQMLGKTASDPQWMFLDEDKNVMSPDDFPVNRALTSSTDLKNYVVGIDHPDKKMTFWLACNSHRVKDVDNKLKSILVSFLDITDTRQALNELQESKQKFQSMVDNIGSGVVLINQNMEIIEINQKMRDWFSDINLSERPHCYQVFNDPAMDAVCDDCQTINVLRDGIVQEKRRMIPSAGKNRHYRIVSSPIINTQGQVTGVIELFEDITENLKIEAQLRQSQKLEAIGTLAGGIAHDFNNILSAVLGFTELALGQTEKDTSLSNDLKEVYAAGNRAKQLISQILTFARQSQEERKPIQVYLIVKEVLKFIRSSIPTTIEIKQNIKSRSFILGNDTQLHQIMMNLCTNAAHAMSEGGGTLEVTLEDVTIDGALAKGKLKFGKYVEIKVRDTGTGIEPYDIDKIFEPYFTTKSQGEGTGIGLAVVHGIVETYGGKIFAESTAGKGTLFSIYLPIWEKNKNELPSNPKELPIGQERILFVDDEHAITRLTSRILGQLGYSVATKTSSVEALELFRSEPNYFDLIISDLTMPHMTGDELAKRLIQIRPDIPIILCTGYSKTLSEEKASEIGIQAFAQKPIIKEHLAMLVRDVLDKAKN